MIESSIQPKNFGTRKVQKKKKKTKNKNSTKSAKVIPNSIRLFFKYISSFCSKNPKLAQKGPSGPRTYGGDTKDINNQKKELLSQFSSANVCTCVPVCGSDSCFVCLFYLYFFCMIDRFWVVVFGLPSKRRRGSGATLLGHPYFHRKHLSAVGSGFKRILFLSANLALRLSQLMFDLPPPPAPVTPQARRGGAPGFRPWSPSLGVSCR